MKAVLVFLKPYRGSIFLVLGLVFIQTLAELGLPTLMANLIDQGILGGHSDRILGIGLAMFGIAILGAGSSIFSSWVSSRLGSGFGRDLRAAVFHQTVHLSVDQFSTFGSASLITRSTNDITQVQSFVLMSMRMFAVAPLMAIGGLVMALSLDRGLATVLFVSVPVVGLLVALVARRGVVLFRLVQKNLDRLNEVLRETLTGVRVIRAFDRQDFDARRFSVANLDLTRVSLQTQKLMAIIWPGMMLAMSLTGLALVGFGAGRIQVGSLQVGGLIAFLQYSMQILFSLMLLSIVFVIGPRAVVSASRIAEVLALKTQEPANHSTETATVAKGNIRFVDVSYRYPGAEQSAVDHLNFSFPVGKTTALIGGTGAGKTTILNLLMRFRDPTSGRIEVDGRPLDQESTEGWRSQLAFVPQRSRLFAASVKENLLWGNPKATDADLSWATQIAQAETMISELSQTWDTKIEAGGTNLSGGQRQRLAIARALVRRSPYLILDDSFSAIDLKTDALLRRALRKQASDTTVILVAQRVSTVRDADHIVVLDEGHVVGEGSHTELQESCLVYREIMTSQQTGQVLYE